MEGTNVKKILFAIGFLAFAAFVAIAPPAQAMSLTNSEIFNKTTSFEVGALDSLTEPYGGDILAFAGAPGLINRRSPSARQIYLKNLHKRSGLIAFDTRSGTVGYSEVGWS